jgi:hypothetical protein
MPVALSTDLNKGSNVSKASEYAERLRVETPKFSLSGPGCIAYVDQSGWLQPESAATLSPKQALAYALWIIHTFAEPDELKVIEGQVCRHGLNDEF